MSDGKSLSVWYTEDERRRIEEAAALAGYKHVSKYIRDKSLERRGQRDSVETWAEQQEFASRLAEIERNQKGMHAILAMLLFLVRKRATTGEINELILTCEKANMPKDALSICLPELLNRFNETI